MNKFTICRSQYCSGLSVDRVNRNGRVASSQITMVLELVDRNLPFQLQILPLIGNPAYHHGKSELIILEFHFEV